jgi:hypothetical protein
MDHRTPTYTSDVNHYLVIGKHRQMNAAEGAESAIHISLQVSLVVIAWKTAKSTPAADSFFWSWLHIGWRLVA